MRIIGGRFRGTALTPVGKGDPSSHLRPTSDRVRESLFNVLLGGRFGDPVTGARVLDLFAGTGALGLEALSRGAAQATFVETGGPALRLLRGNIAKTRTEAETQVIARDATRLGPCPAAPCNLVFLDPPYGKGLGSRALASALTGGWIAPAALVVWEESAPQDAPPDFETIESRRYGETHITLLRAVTSPSG
ncbi:16S rRNA (guanine(966)-N(2))-methyltransferase RsmD [Palleronia sp. KMU-117]|uniref:16S rRNA (guanine(966)-N(2))-methyltransferase RsmD n=1 Tax=Palleronia sp. KMU-117 TaxID=3434108 RepID=UPI003D7299A4